jgi:hypothetical protein
MSSSWRTRALIWALVTLPAGGVAAEFSLETLALPLDFGDPGGGHGDVGLLFGVGGLARGVAAVPDPLRTIARKSSSPNDSALLRVSGRETKCHQQSNTDQQIAFRTR